MFFFYYNFKINRNSYLTNIVVLTPLLLKKGHRRRQHRTELRQMTHTSPVDSGDPVVVILAIGSEVRGFKPGRCRWIFSERKNPEYDFLWKGSKAVGPVS